MEWSEKEKERKKGGRRENEADKKEAWCFEVGKIPPVTMAIPEPELDP